MKRFSLAALALILVIGLQTQSARADSANANWNTFWSWLTRGQEPGLFWSGVGIGIGTDVGSYYAVKKTGTPPHRPMSAGMAYGVTTYACAVVYPIVGTLVLNRPLTPREMYDGVGDCVVPFIGGWLVDAWLPHTAWIDGTPPKPVKGHK
jgi:hypothetical protein